ncbi:hypothetical protein GJQ54_04480 [Oceanospirillaceae bacterium ASx5O]|nr:hypothetical protein GJQ54_04480 [Oceanospirillaceae bacterium ASx5O]
MRYWLLLTILWIAPVYSWWPQPVLLPEDAAARLPDMATPPETVAEPQQTLAADGSLESSRAWLAGYLNSVSGSLDSFFVDAFFGDDLIGDDVSGTRGKISMATRKVSGDALEFKFGVSVKLDLPNTNDRLKLLIESDEEDEGVQQNFLDSVDNTSYSTALRFLVNERAAWRTDFDVGIRGGLPFNPFSRFRARRYAYLSEWEMRATQTLYYFRDDGWGEDTELRLDYPLNTEKLFRINTRARYLLDNRFFDLNYDLALYHELGPHSVLAYNAGASGDSAQGATFYSYYAGVRYRRQVYRDWVFFEIAPQFEWHRDTDYRTRPVLMLRLESLISQD